MRAFWSRLLFAVTAFSLLFFFTAPVAQGQLEPYHVNKAPYCTVANLATCANQGPGRTAYIVDGDDVTDTTSGGGTAQFLALYTTAWQPLQLANQDQMVFSAIFCGQADESGTIYLGKEGGDDVLLNAGTAGTDLSIAGGACDVLDHATDASINAPFFTDVAVKSLGGVCTTNGTIGAEDTLAFTIQADDADTSPAQTCTVGTAEKSCSITAISTTDIVANGKVSVEAVMTGNNADDDLWCLLTFAAQ